MFAHDVAYRLKSIHSLVATGEAPTCDDAIVDLGLNAPMRSAVILELRAARERLPRGSESAIARDAYLTTKGECL